jgi:hypothetical protein
MLVPAMNKYRSIELLLQHLARAIAEGEVAIADRWLEDEEAVRFYKPGAAELAASVTTHGQPPGWYDVELEFPDLEDNRFINAPTTAEDVQLNDVLGLLAVHFDLTDLPLQDQARD